MCHSFPVWIVVSTCLLTTAAGAAPDDAARARRIAELLERHAAFGFTGQVLVARGDRVLHHAAYGAADRSTGRPLTVDTPLGIASMSKAFTAAVVMKLEAAGRLRRDAPLGTLRPDTPEAWRGITLHQVLAHTAGLPGGYDDDFRAPDAEAAIAALLAQAPLHPPGTGWRYSSEGYNLPAAVASRAAGLAWADLLEREIFAPLAMTHTTTLDRVGARRNPPAHAYVGWRDRGSPAVWPRNFRVTGGGDLVSTAADLHRWARALRADPAWRAIGDTLWARHAHLDGSAWYGYGAISDSTGWGTRRVEQAGDTELGFNGALLVYPDEDAEIIVLCNARAPDGRSMRHAVLGDIETVLLRGDTVTTPPAARPLDARERDALAGRYDLPAAPGALRMVDDGRTLWLAAERQEAVDALLGLMPAARAAARRGNARTDSLLRALHARDTLALTRALGPGEGAAHAGEYQDEWRRLVARHGALIGWQVLGSTPRRGPVRSWARLEWVNGTTVMTWAWADSGRGRLAGSAPDAPPAPLVVSLAASPRGALLACDPITARWWTLAPKVAREGATLVLAPGMEARRRPGAPSPESARD
jgi:CubicO group peptidase (beta-lactamase class C family)